VVGAKPDLHAELLAAAAEVYGRSGGK